MALGAEQTIQSLHDRRDLGATLEALKSEARRNLYAVDTQSGTRSPFDSKWRLQHQRQPTNNGWIYHVPGMPYYAEPRAEQFFLQRY